MTRNDKSLEYVFHFKAWISRIYFTLSQKAQTLNSRRGVKGWIILLFWSALISSAKSCLGCLRQCSQTTAQWHVSHDFLSNKTDSFFMNIPCRYHLFSGKSNAILINCSLWSSKFKWLVFFSLFQLFLSNRTKFHLVCNTVHFVLHSGLSGCQKVQKKCIAKKSARKEFVILNVCIADGFFFIRSKVGHEFEFIYLASLSHFISK